MYNTVVYEVLSHPAIVIGALIALITLFVVILYELNNRVLTPRIRAILFVALFLLFAIALKIILNVCMLVLMICLFSTDAPDGTVHYIEDEDD